MAGQKSDVGDTRSLSGGERSFTTIGFILSLADEAESPAIALDEWDVFMDVAHRKISFDNLISFAKSSRDKQFLLLTPQDIQGLKPGPDLKILRLKAARP